MKHLAIFKGNGAELILTGKKTVESRFSNKKSPPFGVITSGDLVYIKPSGKDIIGEFRVKKVIFFDNPDLSDLSHLSDLKEVPKYVTLIFIGNSTRFLTSPVKLSKKDRRGWVVLD